MLGLGEVDGGRAVQVDPVKPKLKAAGTKRLKLTCDAPLSDFAFKYKLRRYTASGVTRRGRTGGVCVRCGVGRAALPH